MSLLTVTAGLLAQATYATPAFPFFDLGHNSAKTSTLSSEHINNAKISSITENGWVNLDWPTTDKSSELSSISFDQNGNLYATVEEDPANGDGFPKDVYMSSYHNGAWHKISPTYSMKTLATIGMPTAIGFYHNKTYSLFAQIIDIQHPTNATITLRAYQRKGDNSWTLIPNSKLPIDKGFFPFNGFLSSNDEEVLLITNIPPDQNLSTGFSTQGMLVIYNFATNNWQKVSVPATAFPINDFPVNISTDAAGNIYIEHASIGDTQLKSAAIAVYNIATQQWNTNIPSISQVPAFVSENFENLMGDSRYHVGATNTFYSLLNLGNTTTFGTIYENTEGNWLTNNPISLPIDSQYPIDLFVSPDNHLYTLNQSENTQYVEYYYNGVWQNLGSGTASATIATNNNWDALNNQNMITAHHNLYVMGVEAGTDAPTLLVHPIAHAKKVEKGAGV